MKMIHNEVPNAPHMKNRGRILFLQFAIALVACTAWQIAGTQSPKFFFLLGSPTSVLSELVSLARDGALTSHMLVTGSEALSGLLIGTIVGSSLGLVLWYSETLAETARPFVIGLGTIPVFAFAPLMIIWFGIGLEMKIAMAAFSTIFVAFSQAHRGALLVGGEYVEMLRGMDAQKGQIFLKVIIPGSLDWVLASMRLNVGFGLLGAFIGEFIAADRGLGYLILRAGGLYNIPRALAAAVGIVVLALGLDFGAREIEKRRHLVVQFLSVPRRFWTKRK